MEIEDGGVGENFPQSALFVLNRRSWRGHTLVTVKKRRQMMKREEVRKGG